MPLSGLEMRDLADKYKDKLGSGVIVLASESDGASC